MGDRLGLPCLGTPGAVDFLANPQLPSVASMANPLGGPGRGSSLGSETHPAFIIYLLSQHHIPDIGRFHLFRRQCCRGKIAQARDRTHNLLIDFDWLTQRPTCYQLCQRAKPACKGSNHPGQSQNTLLHTNCVFVILDIIAPQNSPFFWEKNIPSLCFGYKCVDGCNRSLISGIFIYKYLPHHIRQELRSSYIQNDRGGDSSKHSINILSPNTW